MSVVLESKARRPSFLVDVICQAFGKAFTREFWVNVFTVLAGDLAAMLMQFAAGKLAFYAKKMANGEPSQQASPPFSSGGGSVFSQGYDRPSYTPRSEGRAPFSGFNG